MRVTILGCGGSGGVPLVGGVDGRGEWGACDPEEPRNRRTRCSVLVEQDDTAILIDTSPDLRHQLLSAGVSTISAVLYTHAHADHCHGIDDLRGMRRRGGRDIDVYAAEPTLNAIESRFVYAFEGGGGYPPVVRGHVVNGPFTIGSAAITPFEQFHGYEKTVGYRIGNMAYSVDVVDLPEDSLACLHGLDLWIVDCLRMTPHPTHAHFERTLDWVAQVRPKRALLTHMDASMDYATVRDLCPAGVEPAYDQQTINVNYYLNSDID